MTAFRHFPHLSSSALSRGSMFTRGVDPRLRLLSARRSRVTACGTSADAGCSPPPIQKKPAPCSLFVLFNDRLCKTDFPRRDRAHRASFRGRANRRVLCRQHSTSCLPAPARPCPPQPHRVYRNSEPVPSFRVHGVELRFWVRTGPPFGCMGLNSMFYPCPPFAPPFGPAFVPGPLPKPSTVVPWFKIITGGTP